MGHAAAGSNIMIVAPRIPPGLLFYVLILMCARFLCLKAVFLFYAVAETHCGCPMPYPAADRVCVCVWVGGCVASPVVALSTPEM